MSRLLFVLILIGSALLLSEAAKSAEEQKSKPPISKKDKASNESDKTTSKGQPPKAGETPLESVTLKALRDLASQEKARYEEQKADDKRWWPPTAPWAIVYVTIAYVLVAIFQWAAIARQANIAERNITHLERPWIMVAPRELLYWHHHTGRQPGASFNIEVSWSATNVGRSPAFLVHLVVELTIAPYPIPDLPPQYPQFQGFAEMPIAPNNSHSHNEPLTITDAEFDMIKRRERCIMLYGFAQYHDVLRERLHATRFCAYWWLPNANLPSALAYEPVGPRGYIEYT